MVRNIVRETLLIVGLMVLAFIPRLYRITYPLADWHSWRQADTASVTREYLKHDIDLLHPTFQDISDVQASRSNPKGYRMVEFPILNAFTSLLIRGTNLQLREVVVGRLITIMLSLITTACIYIFGREVSGKRVGVFGALVFALLPYSIYYSRTILPDPATLTFVMLSLVATVYWLRSTRRLKQVMWFGVAAVSFAVALLLKPFALVFAPIFLALAIKEKGWKTVFQPAVYLLPVFAVLPLLWWRNWILQFPEGIPGSSWLFDDVGIRFSGAFWHWLFEIRIANLMLGIGLIVPLVLGLVRRGKDWLVYVVWGVCMFAYLAIVAGGNIRHDYYQILLVPFLALTVARGMDAMLRLPKALVYPWLVRGSLLILSAFSVFVSWYTIRGYFNVNKWEIVEAGKAIDRLAPPDAKVIAPYGGDTAFLFQTNRTGWPIGGDIERFRREGATYYASINLDDETKKLMRTYTVVEQTPRYVIVKLEKPLR